VRPRALIRVLLRLHPKRWRAEYGDEYRDLLESAPLTRAVVLDVLRTAARLQFDARLTLLRLLGALAVSALAELAAGLGNLSDNILWLPISPLKAALLAAAIAPWVVAVMAIRRDRRRRSTLSQASTLGVTVADRAAVVDRASVVDQAAVVGHAEVAGFTPTANLPQPVAASLGQATDSATPMAAAPHPVAPVLRAVPLSWRRRVQRWLGRALVSVVAAFLIIRALVELFVISPFHPEAYRHDWGGPHYAGVLLVHCGPGLLALVLLLSGRWRRLGSRG
jgi:hypothetical protein